MLSTESTMSFKWALYLLSASSTPISILEFIMDKIYCKSK